MTIAVNRNLSICEIARKISISLKLRFTAMVRYSFHMLIWLQGVPEEFHISGVYLRFISFKGAILRYLVMFKS